MLLLSIKFHFKFFFQIQFLTIVINSSDPCNKLSSDGNTQDYHSNKTTHLCNLYYKCKMAKEYNVWERRKNTYKMLVGTPKEKHDLLYVTTIYNRYIVLTIYFLLLVAARGTAIFS